MPVNNLTRLSVEQQEEVRCEMAHVRMGHLRLDRASSKFGNVRYVAVSSTDQCNTACSLSAGVSKPKVFRGR